MPKSQSDSKQGYFGRRESSDIIMDELGECAKMADDELIVKIAFPHQYYLITLQEEPEKLDGGFLKRWNWGGV